MARSSMDPRVRLEKWLKANNETESSFAKRIGVNRSVVWRWLHGDGQRSPSRDLAYRVEDATGIPARSWTSKAA